MSIKSANFFLSWPHMWRTWLFNSKEHIQVSTNDIVAVFPNYRQSTVTWTEVNVQAFPLSCSSSLLWHLLCYFVVVGLWTSVFPLTVCFLRARTLSFIFITSSLSTVIPIILGAQIGPPLDLAPCVTDPQNSDSVKLICISWTPSIIPG